MDVISRSILVKDDIAMLMKELTRLRPELSLGSSPEFTLPQITANRELQS
jgi:hypothetical protein